MIIKRSQRLIYYHMWLDLLRIRNIFQVGGIRRSAGAPVATDTKVELSHILVLKSHSYLIPPNITIHIQSLYNSCLALPLPVNDS